MRTIIDIFFRQKPVIIEVGGIKQSVRKAIGSHDVYVDEQGQFILGRWQPKPVYKTTPLQRARDPWPPDLKGYIIYPRGLASAWRSRQLAMFGAWRQRIPTLEKLTILFDKEIRERIRRRVRLSSKNEAKLWRAGYLLMKSRKPELKEAQTEIFFLYRDLKGDINIGAALAETTAITSRLREALEGTYGWLAVYSGQASFLNQIQKYVDHVFDKAKHSFTAMFKHGFFTKQAIPDSQVVPLLKALGDLEENLLSLESIQPYRAWAKFTLMDLKALVNAIKLRRFDEGEHFLLTLLASFEIKRQQRFFDRFLLETGKACVTGKWKDVFGHWLERLLTAFKQLQIGEEALKFRQPVCEKMVDSFLSAKDIINSGGNLKQVARILREAYLRL